MRIVLATNAMHAVGGSETYLTTLGEHLRRLGHDVGVYTRVAGDMATDAQRRGLRVVDSTDDLGAPADAVLSQDGVVAHDLAAAWPAVPQAFVCHSSLFDLQQPPLVPGIVSTVIVLNDRVRRRVEALNTDVDVVRLTQPIDTQRFSPLSAPGVRPRRALVLSSYLDGAPRRALDEACAIAGIEVVSLGVDEMDLSPELAIDGADLVVGKGRAALEALSCGRPAYLFDSFGGDGWVTPASYRRIEADGFTGQAGVADGDAQRLASHIAAYDAEWGRLGREIVLRRHDARQHAHEVLDVLTGLGAGHGRTPTLESELARQVQLRWHAEGELFALRAQMRRTDARTTEERARAEDRLREAQQATAAVSAELDAARARVALLEVRTRRLRRRLRRHGIALPSRRTDVDDTPEG